MSEVMQHVSNVVAGVSLSEAAKRHILSYLDKQNEVKGIRLSVKKTGCSGLSYVVDYVKTPHENDIVQPITENYQLCIDKASYPYLKGMKVDYVRQGLNYKFVFDNPNQKGQCGCGESFTVDEF
ncbi:HesB/IscA family protein [Legionella brunensis]|uniref:Fe-S cluster assembly protein n=1 Tax=Legionella brunensis TaxID=29422 RepID=A0A0W0SLB1_9GAMM|nr:iron-sulfur cluster assembly accessory protein [Legionella brunensis]KTC84176.1 Fe-S cluster assembly protein [Legionella brunensis]